MQIQIRQQIQRAGCDEKPGNAVPRCFQRVTRRRLGGSACFAGWRLCHTNTRLCWATNTKDIVCVTNATRCWAKYYKILCFSYKYKSEVKGNDLTFRSWWIGFFGNRLIELLYAEPQMSLNNKHNSKLFHGIKRVNSEGWITQTLLAPPQSLLIFAEFRCILSVQLTIYFT